VKRATRNPLHDIKVVVRGLAGRAPELAQQLLPHGKRSGHEWVSGDLYGEPGTRCAVHLVGAKAGVWSNFASGEAGDALDLVAAVLYGGDKKAAFRWALYWLGLDGAEAPEIRRRIEAAPSPDDEQLAPDRRQKAAAMWLAGKPLEGTPAAAYLMGRGIDLGVLGRAPGALRFHPALWCAETNGHCPAMVAQIQRVTSPVAVHRTYLGQRPDGAWGKAQLKQAKMVLGDYRGGFIPLWRGASGQPLSKHPEADTLAITEGIEDALTIALHQPKWRVIAAISVGNVAALILPPTALDIVLVQDRDGENPHVRRARDRAQAALLEQGRAVRVVQPEEGFKDFNDWHQAQLRAGDGGAA